MYRSITTNNNTMNKLIIIALFLFFLGSINLNAQVVEQKPKEPSKKLLKTDVEKPTTNVTWVWIPGEWYVGRQASSSPET